MSDLQSKPAEFRAVIQITRKATGKVEEYVLTGTPELVDKEPQNGSDAPSSVSQHGRGPSN
jgi:hypothetical protein